MPARYESGKAYTPKRKAKRAKPKPYVRPRIEAQPGPITSKERKAIKRAQPLVERTRAEVRKAVGKQRPAPKAQPGPVSDSDRQNADRFKKTKTYKRARRDAREAGQREKVRQYLRSRSQPGPFTDSERSTARKYASSEAFKRAVDDTRKEREGRDNKDTDTHIGPFNIEAELEGRGGVAKAGEYLKGKATSKAGMAGIRAAGLPLPPGEYGENAAKDLVDIPTQVIPSTYAVAAGVKEAAEGRPQRIKRLAKDFKEHDPVALAAQGKFGKAVKEAEKHPVLTGLSVSGVGSAVSRTAGAGVRGAGATLRHTPAKGARKAGRRLRKIGSTKRAPKVAPGTNMREERTYHKGLVEKGVQHAIEGRKVRRARKLRQQARRARNPKRKDELRRQAAEQDPRIMSEADIARRVDEREHVAEVRRRAHRAEAGKKADKALPKKHADLALLVARGVVKPTRESIEGYVRKLDGQAKSGGLSKSQKQANRKLRAQLADALKDKKLNFKEVDDGAKAYAKTVGPLQKELVDRGIVDRSAERMARLIPIAVREMGAKWNKDRQRLELRGEKLPVSRVENFLRSTGRDPDDLAYFTQAPGQRGAKNFFQSWHEPKGAMTGRLTGEATRKGTFEVNRDVGVENAVKPQGLIDAHQEYAEFVGEHGYRPRDQARPMSFEDRKAAQKFIRENLADHAYIWRPVAIRPQFGRKSQSDALLDKAEAEDVSITPSVREGVEDALGGKVDGKYVLVPDAAAKRLGEHSRLLGSAGTKVTRKVGRQFSSTVLTTSGFTWPVGNLVEGSVRLAVARAGPGSLALGRKTVKALREIDPKKAEELEARVGTGHIGSYELNNVHATAQMFKGTKFGNLVARPVGAFFRTPGPKQVAKLWDGYTRVIFGANGFIEHQMRTALLGRYLKNQGYSPAKLGLEQGTKALAKASHDAARGLTNTNAQVSAARFIRRAYGQYEAWSPQMRFTIAVFTPFVAWSLNAVKFVGSVLPKDHPVLTGLIASAERASEEWRNQMGLGKFIDGAAPGWMQASIPVDGKLVPIGRFTPFGFFADPLEAGGSAVLPQINGIIMASKGLDWKGEPLGENEKAGEVPEGERAKEIARAMAGAFVPFFGLQERVRDKGAKVLNPARGYDFDHEVSAAFDELDRVEAEKAAIKEKHPKVDSDHPTPEYARLHQRSRDLNERIHKLSKGKYGTKYKEPYEPSNGIAVAGDEGDGGSWMDEYGGSGQRRARKRSWMDDYGG
jgi:hypothetical protein